MPRALRGSRTTSAGSKTPRKSCRGCARAHATVALGAGTLQHAACRGPLRYDSPVPIGSLVRVAIDVGIENPRRIRYAFEIFDTTTNLRVAHGFVRVACVGADDFAPRDFPAEVL